MNHGKIYMDYQASTPIDQRVIDAMTPYFFERPGNPHATDHTFGWEANSAVESAAEQIANTIGASADEIIFTSGATEANNLAILGAAARRPPERHRIFVSTIEHKCVLAAAEAAAIKYDCIVEKIPVDKNGFVDLDLLKNTIDNKTLMVSIMAANNEIGTLQNNERVGEICREAGALFHSDAVQRLAAGGFDVEDWNADFVSLSSHKLYGPKGIGALYIRRERQRDVEPLIYGGGQQGGLRSGTLPVHLCVGFGKAASLMVTAEAKEESSRLSKLRDEFINSLTKLDSGIFLNGPTGNQRHPGNANIRFSGRDAKDVLSRLQPRLAASTGSACYSGIPEPSHVLRAIGLSGEDAEASVRFSIGRFSTLEDIKGAVEQITKLY